VDIFSTICLNQEKDCNICQFQRFQYFPLLDSNHCRKSLILTVRKVTFMHWILYVTQTRTMMTFVLILWMKKIIGERSFPSLGERMLTIKLLGWFTRQNQLLPDRKKIVIFLIFHCWWLACIVSFTCIKPFSLLLILIRNWQHWVHNTLDENKQNTTRKTKKLHYLKFRSTILS
jgi:hypothetical protein